MKPCLLSEVLGMWIWHYHVVKVACEGPCKQRRKKESNVAERTALLKQQPEQKNTN